MAMQERKKRERAERHRLIVDAARELAESEGWDAVTTRRLADKVEYSQPVLYSHFKNKDAILAAVALQGFADLAGVLRQARLAAAGGPPEAVARAYLEFADRRPVLYEAMFTRPIKVAFTMEQTPEPLRAVFGEIVAALEPVADGRDGETLAEVFWSALHGQATLDLGGRLRRDHRAARVGTLVSLLA